MDIDTGLVTLLAFLITLDGIMTYWAVARQGATEINPFMVGAIDKIGLVPALLATRGPILLLLAYAPLHLYLLIAMAVLYVGLTASNIYQFIKGR